MSHNSPQEWINTHKASITHIMCFLCSLLCCSCTKSFLFLLRSEKAKYKIAMSISFQPKTLSNAHHNYNFSKNSWRLLMCCLFLIKYMKKHCKNSCSSSVFLSSIFRHKYINVLKSISICLRCKMASSSVVFWKMYKNQASLCLKQEICH